jgi:hypothetical protein
MNQVSRPMQIMLAAVLVFAALWFVALKPKDDAIEPVAATPVTTTPRAVDAGGAKAASAPGKAVEAANNAAKTANAATQKQEAQTGEDTAAATTSAAATSPKGTTPAGTTPAKAAKPTAKQKAKAKAKAARSKAQREADRVTEQVAKDLKARRAVVVLVASTTGSEDKILRTRVTKQIDRRGGRVKVYLVPVKDVGVYDGLLGSLNIAQTPSTIVIASNNQAKVLGGLVSTARIDRLTSAALLVKPDTATGQ